MDNEHAIIEAARHAIKIWRRPKLYDEEDFEDAMSKLADSLPPEPYTPRPKREDDPF